MKNHKYLVLAMPPSVDSAKSWEEELQATTAIAHTFKKAYELSLFLAGITKPDIKYRKALETIKVRKAVTVQQAEGEQKATVVMTRIY